MTDHQHAADAEPSEGAAPDEGTRPSPQEPRAHAEPGGTPGAVGGRGGRPGPPGAEDPEQPGSPRPFRRDREHKMLSGVCAGLGRHSDVDPVIFRITLAVLAAAGGIGLIFYGFAWLFVPYDDEEENEVRKLLTGRVDGQALAAVLFALVGCGVFLSMLNNGSVLTFGVVLSLLLAGAGYWSQRRRDPGPDPIAAQAVADAPPEAQAPPAPISYSWWRDPIVKDGTHVGGTGYLWGPGDARKPDITSLISVDLIGHGGAGEGTRETRAPHAERPGQRGPRRVGGWVFLLALLAAALGTGLTWDTQPLGTSLQTGLACALLVFGAGIALSAFLGRTGAGSIVLAAITAGLLAGAAAVPKDIGTQWTRTTWRPATAADVRPAYDLGAGVGTLDLSGLDLAAGKTVSTAADVAVGRVRVIVPADMTVKADIEVGVGDIRLPGEDSRDVDVQPGKHRRVTLAPAGGTASSGTLDLDLHVGLGQAEVTRAAS
ncbi:MULTISPECIES: PspC domain-containing protein [unclassified Streptomyces]|uniref:PspC domain-containing protein n=1 Tax=unclassified Streptomyces TaxID=2593676 RepID=UPI001F036B99|nr:MULTISPECIES: PspC domain-containing protein [unclassified Streptomyces]MCH0563972.1 PspC domain-containing protein [Streptomyces sp. MUM 2J]MCH0570739.1 PspC domain-containing protein [Streptomyces sp. MUM 136J]